MVCKVAPDDEAMASSPENAEVPQACILVKDVLGSSSSSTQILWLVGTIRVSHLLQRICEPGKFSAGTFELVFEHPSTGKTTLLSECTEMTLEQVGFVCDGGTTKNKVFVTNLDSGTASAKTEEIVPENEEESENATYASFTLSLRPRPGKPERFSPVESSVAKEMESSAVPCESQFDLVLAKPEIKFTGLVNQAMTCYLNSLVQTLYMTPEFRNALYRWRFDGTEEEQAKSIPFQLQKLFLQLQTSEKSAVGTTNLTRSFGWDSSEAWQQHDIQELCRVMFDALEHKFKNTEEADLISRLYEGKMIDYVRCLECSTEKAREDTFLDIPLPVRPFGSQTSYGSVEEALKAFVMPETLDGNNQYWCERCNKKCDAHKGLKFSRFPYLLTLHLKRFDFDYNTLHRIKLNDKVTFPEVLDLSPLIVGEEVGEKNKDTHDAGNEDSLSEVSELSAANSTAGTESQEDDEGIDVGTEGAASTVSGASNSSKGTSSGPKSCSSKPGFAYELFSIMIHSGSASGGHYYAYIKDFASHQWYCFNDQNVSRITYDDIRKTYGGGSSWSSGYYSSAYSSSANAYMLMYRQVDKTRNADFISATDFPPHISSLLERLKNEEISAKDAEEKERNTCKIQLYCRHPKRGKIELPLKLHRDTTLREATSIGYETIGDLKQNGIALERCRLVKYNDFYDTVDCSWDEQIDEPVHQVFGGVRSTYKFDLLLEIVGEGEKFQVYTPGCASVRLMHVKVEDEELNVVESVRISVNSSVSDLKHKVIELLGLQTDSDLSQIHVVLTKFTNDLRLLEDDEISLQSSGFRRTEKIYVTSSVQSGWTPQFKQKFYDLIERFEHSVTVIVTLPDVRKETLERLGIDTNVPCPAARPVSPSDSLSPDCGFEDSLSRLEKERALSEGEEDDEEGRVEYKELDNEEGASSFSEPEEGGEVSCPDQNVASTSTSASASEDSSLSLTDSDRTLLGDPPEEIPEVDDDGDGVKSSRRRNAVVQDEEPNKCFFMVLSAQDLNERGKVCNVLADKRIPLSHFKVQLESLLGVPADYLLVYKKTAASGFSSASEREWASPSETLETLGDDPEVVVRLGRALRPGEVRGKIYLLDVRDSVEKSKLLFDWILSPESTVGQVKQHIRAEAKASCGLDIPYEKCVLRKKNWRTPSSVYVDEADTFASELMYIFKNWEMYLQILDLSDPEDVSSAYQNAELVLFSRQWHADTLTLGPFINVPLKKDSRKEFAAFLEQKFSVPAEFIEITKASGNFPCDMSVLSIHDSLNWFPVLDESSDSKWPCNIQSDGDVVLWRDKRVALKKLSDQERKEILQSENRDSPSLTSSTSYSSYSSPRREKGLKIYLDTPTGVKDDIDVD